MKKAASRTYLLGLGIATPGPSFVACNYMFLAKRTFVLLNLHQVIFYISLLMYLNFYN